MLRLLLLLASTLPLFADYAVFDDIQNPTPTWISLAGAGAPPVIYRISRHAGMSARIELHNRGAVPVHLGFRLGDYQDARSATIRLELPANGISETIVPLVRIDQGLFRLVLPWTTGAGEPAMTVQTLTKQAWTVSTAASCAGFRAETLAYTALMRDERTVDVHVRNCSTQVIHCDMVLAGYQRPGVTNPRLHLLPGSTSEVLMTVERADDRAMLAILDVWNVRLGEDDQGPLLLPQRPEAAQPPTAAGWQPLACDGALENHAGFNPRVVVWRLEADGGTLTLANRSDSALDLTVRALTGSDLRVQVRIPAHEEVRTTIPQQAKRLHLAASAVRIDGNDLQPASRLTASAVPEQSLAVTPRSEDPRFNPQMLAYVLSRAGDGQAQVQVINRSGITINADYRIAGYQDPQTGNPRLRLAPGAATTLSLPVKRSDARLALARLLVWNVRLGRDEGPALVAQ